MNRICRYCLQKSVRLDIYTRMRGDADRSRRYSFKSRVFRLFLGRAAASKMKKAEEKRRKPPCLVRNPFKMMLNRWSLEITRPVHYT